MLKFFCIFQRYFTQNFANWAEFILASFETPFFGTLDDEFYRNPFDKKG